MVLSQRLELGSLVVFFGLAAACSSSKKIDVGGDCLLNSDCNSPLVCTMNRCHAGCRETRDCPAGQSCTVIDGAGVCQLPGEAECDANGTCADPRLFCASDLRCRARCATAGDCSAGQVCTRSVCADGKDIDVTTGQLPQKQPLPDAGAPDSAPEVASGPEAGPDLGADSSRAPANLVAAPKSVPFNSVPQGQASKEGTVTLVNGGEEDTGAITFGIENAEFAIVGGGSSDCRPRAILKPSDSCTIRITLTPAGIGTRSGKLTFTASPGGNGEVSLSGTGTCTADTLPDDTEKCVPMAGVEWVQRGPSLNWTSVASSTDGTMLVAGASQGNLYTSSDSGGTWTARASARVWSSVASSADGSHLLASDSSQSGAACLGDLFSSADFGVSWQASGQTDCWRSVASSADGVYLFAATAGISGPPKLVASNDTGVTWRTTLTDLVMNTRIAASADGTRVLALGLGKVWLSTDFGHNWTGVSSSSQPWSAVGVSGDGSLLVLCALGTAGYIYLSRDDGVSWSEVGPAQSYASVASSSDGKRLLAGVAGGNLFHSIDGGKTWAQRASVRSWSAVASSADGTKLVAVAANGYIYTSSGPLP